MPALAQHLAHRGERHLDFFLRDSGSICSDHCFAGDALSYYGAAGGRARIFELASADLRGMFQRCGRRGRHARCQRRRRRRENALEGRSTSIARRWIFQPGDEAICGPVRRRRPRPALRHREPHGRARVRRGVLDGRLRRHRDITLISTVLKKDLAALNAGETIEAREKAPCWSEVTLAVRTRAEQRRIIAEAGARRSGRTPGTAAVDWRACGVRGGGDFGGERRRVPTGASNCSSRRSASRHVP